MTEPLHLRRDDALFLGRWLYAGLIILLFPLKSPRWLTPLGDDHFHPPLGPFALFDSYPPLWFVVALEAVAALLLALWIPGWGRWMVGTGLTVCLTIMSGFLYSAGKIDHDLVILLVPMLMTLPGISPKRALLFCLAVYFASSGLAKALGGWLDPGTQATLSWALLYFHDHGKTEAVLEWTLTSLPGWSWEILDQLTVWFELLVPLALLPRLRPWIALLIPGFHFGVLLLFGIDFARLLLVYLPLALMFCAAPPGRGRPSPLAPGPVGSHRPRLGRAAARMVSR